MKRVLAAIVTAACCVGPAYAQSALVKCDGFPRRVDTAETVARAQGDRAAVAQPGVVIRQADQLQALEAAAGGGQGGAGIGLHRRIGHQ